MAPEPDQPVADAPVVEPDAPADDTPFNIADVPEEYRDHVERYNKQLQGAFTQKTQAHAEQLKQWEANKAEFEQAKQFVDSLSDQNARAQLFRKLAEQEGYVLDDDEEDDDDPYLPRLERLEQDFQRQAQLTAAERQQAIELDHLDDQLSEIEEGLDRELTDGELKVLLPYAHSNLDANGLPDLRGAFDIYKGILDAQEGEAVDKFVESKKAARVTPPGVPAKEEPNLMDPEVRQELMAEIVGSNP